MGPAWTLFRPVAYAASFRVVVAGIHRVLGAHVRFLLNFQGWLMPAFRGAGYMGTVEIKHKQIVRLRERPTALEDAACGSRADAGMAS